MANEQGFCRLPLRYCVPGMKVGGRIAADSGIVAGKGAVLDGSLIDSMTKIGVGVVPIELDEASSEIYEDFRVNKPHIQSLAEHTLGYKKLKRELASMFDAIVFGAERLGYIVRALAERAPLVGREGLFACVDGVRDVDEYLYTHSLNVSLLAYLMSDWLGIEGAERFNLMYAGLVHDVGMLKVDPEIMYKTDAILAEEMRAIKRHPRLGVDVLMEVFGIPEPALEAVYCHHERLNGSGYPRGLSGDMVPRHSRIIAVCDMYDAMMANKVYRTRQSSFHVFDVLMSDRMNGRLDGEVVDTFLGQLSRSFVGRGVFLEDGRVGRIVHMNPDDFSRPMVKVGNIILDTAAANIGVSDVDASQALEGGLQCQSATV